MDDIQSLFSQTVERSNVENNKNLPMSSDVDGTLENLYVPIDEVLAKTGKFAARTITKAFIHGLVLFFFLSFHFLDLTLTVCQLAWILSFEQW